MLQVTVISGPIGVGKTSVVRALAAEFMDDASTIFIEEDVEAWQYYLQRFYKDPQRYGFWFQKDVEHHFHAVTKRLEQLANDPLRTYHAIVERAPVDALHVFLPLATALSPEDREHLAYALRTYAAHPVWSNARYIFLTSPLELCRRRITLRGRTGEECMSDDYLRNVLERYEALATRIAQTSPSPLHTTTITTIANTTTLHACTEAVVNYLNEPRV